MRKPKEKNSGETFQELITPKSLKLQDICKNQRHLLTGFLIGQCRLREHLLKMVEPTTDE